MDFKLDLEAIVNNSPDIIFAIDKNGKILFANPSFYELLGYSKNEVIGKHVTEFIADKNIYKACMLSVKETGLCLNQDTFFKRRDGSVIHVIKNVRAVRKGNDIDYIIVNARDISAIDKLNTLLEKAKEKLQKQKKDLENIVNEKTKDLEFQKTLLEIIKDTLPIGVIFISKDGNNFLLNENAKRYLGKKEPVSLYSLIFLISKKLKKTSRKIFKANIREILNTGCEGDFEIELKNGRTLHVLVRTVEAKHTFYGYLILFNDITKQKKVEKELKEKLYKDQLTGLPNRFKLIEDIQQVTNPTLAIVNIDNFKEINDFYGHDLGDKLLKEFGKFLRIFCIKHRLKTYKLSGDEFAVLSERFYPKIDFEHFISKLINSIEKKIFMIDEYDIHLNVTIGICNEKENILSKADMALKFAKEQKKPYVFFTKEFDLASKYQHNINIMKKLKKAIEYDRIRLFYQPIINNSTDKIEKYECLVRLIDGTGNVIFPAEFLEIAKKSKLYPKITKIVIDKAFRKFKNSKYPFSINLSVSDILNYPTVEYILDKLKEYKGKVQVIFEILESEGIENFDEIYKFIKEVKSLGAKIAIDDFGSGYSNFEFLLKLEVDYLKIDASIIKNLDTDIYSTIIAETIVNFCKKLGIKTIAEFVHSESVQEIVKNIGIDYSQGYFLGKPSPYLKDDRSKEIVKNKY